MLINLLLKLDSSFYFCSNINFLLLLQKIKTFSNLGRLFSARYLTEIKMINQNPFEVIEEIYGEHYTYLRNFLIGLTKSYDVADDIIQELFAKILTDPLKIQELNLITPHSNLKVIYSFID